MERLSERVSVRLPEDLVAYLEEVAEEWGVSLSEVVRVALEEWAEEAESSPGGAPKGGQDAR